MSAFISVFAILNFVHVASNAGIPPIANGPALPATIIHFSCHCFAKLQLFGLKLPKQRMSASYGLICFKYQQKCFNYSLAKVKEMQYWMLFLLLWLWWRFLSLPSKKFYHPHLLYSKLVISWMGFLVSSRVVLRASMKQMVKSQPISLPPVTLCLLETLLSLLLSSIPPSKLSSFLLSPLAIKYTWGFRPSTPQSLQISPRCTFLPSMKSENRLILVGCVSLDNVTISHLTEPLCTLCVWRGCGHRTSGKCLCYMSLFWFLQIAD